MKWLVSPPAATSNSVRKQAGSRARPVRSGTPDHTGAGRAGPRLLSRRWGEVRATARHNPSTIGPALLRARRRWGARRDIFPFNTRK